MTQKRTPSMYSFYEKEIKEAYQNENWDRAIELINDCPEDVYDALVSNEVIETSVEESRNGHGDV